MTNRFLAILAFALFFVIGGGLLWLAIQSDNAVSALLSFAAGLSMIFLPCTLPLAFVIVPIAAKEQNSAKALGLVTAFGLGLAVTLALYGIVTAFLGGFFGLDQFTRVMFVVAGVAAFLFALTELNLLRIPLPVVTHRVPAWITQGYGKTFLLGLLLGNAGIGCPNPAFYVLLTYIASTGEAVTGAWLGLVHGLGRATPLVFLVILVLLGIKSMDWMSGISRKINLITGAALVIVGALIFTYGAFGMHWWEDSLFHASWNQAVMNVAPNLAEEPDHPVAEGVWEGPFWLGWWSLLLLMLIPLIWYRLKQGMRTGRFLLVSGILLALGISATAGWIEAEHGHGAEGEADHHHEEE